MKNPLAISLIFGFLFSATVVAQATYPPAVGELHPNFELPQIDGDKALSLSDFRGKKVVLVHFASW